MSELEDLRAKVAAVEALADEWGRIPDFAKTEYDQGRVDQRHMAETELREVLTPAGDRSPTVAVCCGKYNHDGSAWCGESCVDRARQAQGPG